MDKSNSFIVAGIIFIVSAIVGESNSGLVAIGCSFIAIGAGLRDKSP